MRKLIMTSRRDSPRTQAYQAGLSPIPIRPDSWVLIPALLLLSIGVVMVGSASIAIAEGQGVPSYHYLLRHLVFIAFGVMLAFSLRVIPIAFFERVSRPLMVLSVLLLLAVFIPGLGHTVNGSTRWIALGVLNLQVSEIVKFFMLIYVAGYLVRHGQAVRTTLLGFIKPMLMVGLAGLLLLLEPDFGATVVIIGTVLGMMYLGGVRFVQFISFLAMFGMAALMLVLATLPALWIMMRETRHRK